LELGREIARIGKDLGRFVLAIGSTDLTHYGPNYGFVPEGIGRSAVDWVRRVNDRFFIEKALEMDGEGVLEHALRMTARAALGQLPRPLRLASLGSKARVLLDYYTSYDVMPDDSFVGYAGLLFGGVNDPAAYFFCLESVYRS